jgi:DNA-binding CsgD family transcriptional regulator
MDGESPRLARADLLRLRDAVRRIQDPHRSLPRREILDLRLAVPKDTGLTVDLEASRQIGMPLLVVRVPIGPRPSPEIASLTAREFEVAGLVAAGLANKEIAARLGIRTSTVKEHVHRILEKTSLPNRAAIARAYVGGAGGRGGTDDVEPAAKGSSGTRHGKQA